MSNGFAIRLASATGAYSIFSKKHYFLIIGVVFVINRYKY